VMFLAMSPGAMPVAKPTPIQTISRASNGCMRMRETISATSTSTLTKAVSSNWISKFDMREDVDL